MIKLRNILLSLFIVLFGLNNKAQHPNILITTERGPNEPTIVLDPKNPDHIVASCNLKSTYYSHDGGLTWNGGEITSTYGVWGDPVMIVDTAGHFYYFHLSDPVGESWVDRIVCQKSTDNGVSWSPGTYTGLNGSKLQDKEWAVIDRRSNNIYVSWTQFDLYQSTNPSDSSIILFSRSIDNGNTWSDPVRLCKQAGDCIDDDNTVEGAVPAIGPNGEIYISWAGPAGIVFDKSLDGGETWLDEDIFVGNIPGGWAYSIPGINRANGLPVTECDTSDSPYKGTIYINWSDQRNGSHDTDVWLTKSVDGGDTWSDPVRINNDPAGTHQFFTWMTVDQANGNLYFVFYDRRNYIDTQTDVYMATSNDGGESFTNFRISESPFIPNSLIFFGDYTDITAYHDMIRPVWTRLDNTSRSLWTALIDVNQMSGIEEYQEPGDLLLEQNYPNPFTGQTYISFRIKSPQSISLRIYNLMGQVVKTLFEDRYYMPGKHVEGFIPSELNLPAGTYFYLLKSDKETIKKKMIYLK
jgi:hypothetical protein